MIVLLDTSNRTVTVCDKVVKVYPWSKLKEITLALEGKDVLYVSEVLAVTGGEVIDLITSSYEEDEMGDQTLLEESELYIHCKTKMKVSASYNGKEYLFKGCYDFRPITSLPDGMLEKCKMVAEGLKSGLLEIIDEREKALLEQQYEENLITKKEDLERLEEIVKGSLDNPIEIDLSGAGNFKRGKK